MQPDERGEKFLPYLWGIETLSFYLRIVRFNYCFYPTYEALKQERVLAGKLAKQGFLPYLWGIETVFLSSICV